MRIWPRRLGLATSSLSPAADPRKMLRRGEPAAGQPRRLRQAPGPFGALLLLGGPEVFMPIHMFYVYIITCM